MKRCSDCGGRAGEHASGKDCYTDEQERKRDEARERTRGEALSPPEKSAASPAAAASAIELVYPCCEEPFRFEDGGGGLPCPKHGRYAIARLRAASAGLREVLDALVPHGTSASRLDLYGKHREGCAGDAKNIACSCGLIQSIARFHRAIARLRAASAGEGALREALEKAADTMLDAATTFRIFGKHVAAEAMQLAERHTRAALAPAQREGK